MHIIAGLYRQRRLSTPKGEKTRPTASRLRESLFNICQNLIEGVRFLDLFAGSGAVGLEALSRGAQSVVFVDNNKEAIRCIRQNIDLLDVGSQAQVLCGPALQILKGLEDQRRQFDFIFADPPYKTPFQPGKPLYYSEKIIQQVDEGSLLAPQGFLFIEEAFEAQPRLNDLKTLILVDSRRMGSAILQQYRRK